MIVLDVALRRRSRDQPSYRLVYTHTEGFGGKMYDNIKTSTFIATLFCMRLHKGLGMV